MSEEKKYVTFRDLRVVSPAQKPTASPAPTSTPSTPNISDTPGATELSPLPTIVDKEQQAEPSPDSSERLSTTSTSSNTSTSRTSSDTSTAGSLLESEIRVKRENSAEKPKRS